MSTAVESPTETAVQTCRAVRAAERGRLAMRELPQPTPDPGHVRVRVEACGDRQSDAATMEGQIPIEPPRVPGHEAVGRVDALGVQYARHVGVHVVAIARGITCAMPGSVAGTAAAYSARPVLIAHEGTS